MEYEYYIYEQFMVHNKLSYIYYYKSAKFYRNVLQTLI